MTPLRKAICILLVLVAGAIPARAMTVKFDDRAVACALIEVWQ